jgi:hypothetical protein
MNAIDEPHASDTTEQTAVHPRKPASSCASPTLNESRMKLFLLGFLTLFLELFFIRYLAGSIWNLGYFPNLVLLSAFVGMGIGFVFHQRISEQRSGLVFQGAFLAAVALILFVSYKHPVVPGMGTSNWHYDLDGDFYFSFVPFKVDDLNYLFFMLCFVAVALIFAGISQRTAKVFRQFAPLPAYTLDILGSCAGILAFIVLSAMRLPAWSWFIIFTVIFVCAMADRWNRRFVPVLLAGLTVFVMNRQDSVLMRDPQSKNPVQTVWSPYQRIEYVEETDPAGNLYRRIFVNGLNHQEIHPVPFNVRNNLYLVPYRYRSQSGLPPYQNVLVIGAGSGNDVTAALENNVAHVDAVEIDPVIANLGLLHNPYGTYRDPRVTLHIDDGRAFLTRTQKKYDLIIFALTDSLVKVSSLSQLRLENYLFTRQSVERATELLNDHGHIVFYNYYRLPFVAERIYRMAEEAIGSAPRVLVQADDFFMICGEKNAALDRTLIPQVASGNLPTDDWPFLYLERRAIPGFYWKGMLTICLLITGLLAVLHFSTRKQPGYHAPGLLPVKIAFVFMGIAFLLLETKSVIQFSLLFGTTWLNNSLTFLAVLVSVLAANWTAQGLKSPKLLSVFFALLVLSCLSSLFFPLQELLHIKSIPMRFIAASLLTFSPIYFANLIFSLSFKDQKIAEHIFGWNLLGATFGGVLEYSSLALGYNALSLIVVACYTVVFVLLLAARKRMNSASPIPAESIA